MYQMILSAEQCVSLKQFMLTNKVHILRNYTTAKQMIAGKEEKDKLVIKKN